MQDQRTARQWETKIQYKEYVDSPTIDEVLKMDRVSIKNTRPYYYVADLNDLSGPRRGEITLPHYVRTGPLASRIVNVENIISRRYAYFDLILEGKTSDLILLVNRDLFILDWPHLTLPKRAVDLWENRFDELHGATAAG